MSILSRGGLVVVAVAVIAAAEVMATGGALVRVADAVAGATFLACGIVVCGRAGWGRQGVVAYVAGLAWFAANVVPGLLFAYRPVMAYAVLGYPAGRARGRYDRVVLLAACVDGSLNPLIGSPHLTLVVSALLLAAAVRRAGGTAATRSHAGRLASRATVLFALAMAVPAAGRLVWTTSAESVIFTLASAALVAAAGGVMLVGLLLRIGHSTGVADAVLELTGGDRLDRATLTRLAGPEGADGWRLDPTAAAAVRSGLELIATNECLHADLEGQVEQVQSSRRRLLAAADTERASLERRLDDRLRPILTGLRRTIGGLASRTNDRQILEQASRLLEELHRLSEDLQQLARGMHPRLVAEDGLATALEDLARRAPVPTTATAPAERFAPLVEATIWYACSEAIANVGKHADASSASIVVAEIGGVLVATVTDDGRGGAYIVPGTGLAGLQDRLSAIGGSLTVDDNGPAGTRVQARVPCPRA